MGGARGEEMREGRERRGRGERGEEREGGEEEMQLALGFGVMIWERDVK